MAARAMGILLALGLGACSGWGGGVSELGRWFAPSKTVEVTERRRGLDCGSDGAESRLQLFDDVAAFERWALSRELQLSGDATLPPGRYALVELGQRPTGGHGLAVSRAAGQRGQTLLLRATVIEPGPDSWVTQAITAPCTLVQLPELPFTVVELYDQQGQLRASSRETAP